MSAALFSDPNPSAVPATEGPAQAAKIGLTSEVECAKCECCGLTEECTPAYIERIRGRNQGSWICGLCGEAVKDEIVRSGRLISTEEALKRHMNFCRKFRSAGPPSNPTVRLISAMRHLFRRGLDSPRGLRSMPASPTIRGPKEPVQVLTRSESCFPTITPSAPAD